MALMKIWRTLRQRGARSALRKVLTVAPAYLGAIGHWKLARCQCCERSTIFIAHKDGSAECRACLFCSANERYELLAVEIRQRYGKKLPDMDVLELDPHSPLRKLLSQARTFTRSFYEEGCTLQRRNGAVCQDITALSFEDNSFDLIVSSEVLEHVPQLDKAFSETARVLRPGGAHLFTVPPREMTRRRATIVGGGVRHIEPPEYHLDPLSPDGILAFWDIGPDLPKAVRSAGLDIKIARGPTGDAGRVVWIAEKVVASL
jgi:SAM-dependent methyltransferase